MDILGQKRKYLIEIILKSLHYFMPHRVLRSIGKLMSQFTFSLIYIIIFLQTPFERFDSFNFHSITIMLICQMLSFHFQGVLETLEIKLRLNLTFKVFTIYCHKQRTEYLLIVFYLFSVHILTYSVS